MSPDSTEEYNRDSKFTLYGTLPYFNYILIDAYRPWVDGYFKQNEEEELWKITAQTKMNPSIRLRSVSHDPPFSKFYRRVPELQGEAREG